MALTYKPKVWASLFFRLNENSQPMTILISHLQLDHCLNNNIANFRIMLLNLLCSALIVFAIATLQESEGALILNVPSEIQEQRRKKSLSISFKTLALKSY
jgi:hypothetical protein